MRLVFVLARLRARRPRLVLVPLLALLVAAFGVGLELHGTNAGRGFANQLRGVGVALPNDARPAAEQTARVSALASLIESDVTSVEASGYWIAQAGVLLMLMTSDSVGYHVPTSAGFRTVAGPEAVLLGADLRYVAARLTIRVRDAFGVYEAVVYALPAGSTVVTLVCVSFGRRGGSSTSFCKDVAGSLRVDPSLGPPVEVSQLDRFHIECGASLSPYLREVEHTGGALNRVPAGSVSKIARQLSRYVSSALRAIHTLPRNAMTGGALGLLRAALVESDRVYGVLAVAASARAGSRVARAENEAYRDIATLSAVLRAASQPLAGWPLLSPSGR
jgi:hypothetical protein